MLHTERQAERGVTFHNGNCSRHFPSCQVMTFQNGKCRASTEEDCGQVPGNGPSYPFPSASSGTDSDSPRQIPALNFTETLLEPDALPIFYAGRSFSTLLLP